MGISLIAAVIVMAAMTGFMILAIRQISALLGRQLRQDAVRAMGIYDELLEQRSEKLQELNRRIREREQAGEQVSLLANVADEREETPTERFNPVSGIGLMAGAHFRSKAFAADHRAVSQAFDLDYDGILQQTADQKEERPKGTATRLLAAIPFDTFCELALLPGEQQLKILEDSLASEEGTLLQEFRTEQQVFDSISFYSWLKGKAKEEQEGIRIYTAQGVRLGALPKGAAVSVSESLCEGIRIVMDGTLYDYSISEQEIS